MLKRICFILLAVSLVVSLVSGCGNEEEIITLSFWHIGGSQTDSSYADRIAQFNKTVGAENNVQVNITYVADTDSLLDKLIASANNEPGANDMPDVIICSLTAIAIGEGRLLDWNDYIPSEELEQYLPQFLEEGQYEGKQYVLTSAKSTDVLYVNKTLFESFSADTGITYEDLSTWEGLFGAADKYVQWAASSTDPRINRTKFFMAESIMDYLQLGTASLDGSIWEDNLLDFSSSTFKKVFTAYAASAMNGGTSLSSEEVISAMISGEIVIGMAPSYRIDGFKDTITYFDNTKVPLELTVLPCPAFEGGTPTGFLRGAGVCAIKSEDERRNQASALFRDWLESTHQYGLSSVPAKESEFEAYIENANYTDANDPVNLGRTVMKVFSEYALTSPNYFGDYYSISEALQSEMRSILSSYSELAPGEPEALAERAYRQLEETMTEAAYAK